LAVGVGEALAVGVGDAVPVGVVDSEGSGAGVAVLVTVGRGASGLPAGCGRSPHGIFLFDGSTGGNGAGGLRTGGGWGAQIGLGSGSFITGSGWGR
jgi:hypothetical protein